MKREHIISTDTPLPSGYTRLNYIEATGTQYIITDIVCGQKVNVRVVFTPTDLSGGIITGCMTSAGRSYIGVTPNIISMGYTNTYAPYNYSIDDPVFGININQMYEFEYQTLSGNYWLKRDGVQLFESQITGVSPTGMNYYIFARNNNNTVGAYSKGKFYEQQIFIDDNFVGNLIPALRESDSKPGTFNTVTGSFRTNAGTGEFLYV